ncbi:unnamed protein product [Lasius platythorax]|uniref:Reverse transcriptase n=2 Tax=Lasius TaxID=488720 RepID=A0A0J7KLG4_LASNI|nr:reverse transcriptase [Lasius niger]
MTETNIGLCAISEPIQVPVSPFWYSSRDGKAVWRWRPEGLKGTCSLVKRGNGFIAIRYNNIHLITCYISPSLRIREFNRTLDELEILIRALRKEKIILCGDFNCKSTLWGCRYMDYRGKQLEDWAVANDQHVVNRGNTPTCVKPQGQSVVDITWATSNVMGEIRCWRVEEMCETLSDHKYITFSIGENNKRTWDTRDKPGQIGSMEL